MLQIHGMTGSFNTSKVLYTAEETGTAYEYISLDFATGDNRTPEHLERHPLGKTPTLTTEYGTLFESGAICRYLARTSTKDLYGATDFARALTDQWLDFFSIHPGRWVGTYAFEKVLKAKFQMGEPNADRIQEAEGFLQKQLAMVDNHLAQHKHLAGDAFTVADIFAFAYLESAVGAEFPLSGHKHLQSWYSALSDRPCVVRGQQRLQS